MTTSIVLETSKGNMEQAAILGSLLLMLSLALVGLASMVRNRRKRRQGNSVAMTSNTNELRRTGLKNNIRDKVRPQCGEQHRG